MSFSRPQPVIELSVAEVEHVMDRLADLAGVPLPRALSEAYCENVVLRAQAAATEREYAVLINSFLREKTTNRKGRSL